MISLYDYLGHKAGSELGKQVYKYAMITGAKVGTKTIGHSPYKNGEIMTYERETIDQFFKVRDIFINIAINVDFGVDTGDKGYIEVPTIDILGLNLMLSQDAELKAKDRMDDNLPY